MKSGWVGVSGDHLPEGVPFGIEQRHAEVVREAAVDTVAICGPHDPHTTQLRAEQWQSRKRRRRGERRRRFVVGGHDRLAIISIMLRLGFGDGPGCRVICPSSVGSRRRKEAIENGDSKDSICPGQNGRVQLPVEQRHGRIRTYTVKFSPLRRFCQRHRDGKVPCDGDRR